MLLSDDDRAPLASYNSSSWRRFLFCIWTWLPAFYFLSFVREREKKKETGQCKKKRKTRLTHTQRQLGGKPAAAAAYTYREARQNIKGFYFSLYTVCVCVSVLVRVCSTLNERRGPLIFKPPPPPTNEIFFFCIRPSVPSAYPSACPPDRLSWPVYFFFFPRCRRMPFPFDDCVSSYLFIKSRDSLPPFLKKKR